MTGLYALYLYESCLKLKWALEKPTQKAVLIACMPTTKELYTEGQTQTPPQCKPRV